MKNDGNSMPDLSTQSSLFFRRGTLANVTNLTAAEVRRKHDRERYASLSKKLGFSIVRVHIDLSYGNPGS
jgi:hypothetical protein